MKRVYIIIKKWEDGLFYELDINNFTAAIIDSYKSSGDVLIPRLIKYQSINFLITSIGDNSFMNNHNINSLIFSEDSELQIIGKRAFSQSSLTKITIPKSVTRIEEKAFYLSELLEIIIPEDSKLEWIGPSAFSFSYITEIFLPKKIRIIEEKTFDSCSSLFYVHFPNDSELISICENGFSWGRMDSFYIHKTFQKLEEIGPFAPLI